MMQEDPAPPKDGASKEILKAVAIAGLSAVVTGFVAWGIDELKARFGNKPDDSSEDD